MNIKKDILLKIEDVFLYNLLCVFMNESTLPLFNYILRRFTMRQSFTFCSSICWVTRSIILNRSR